MECQLTILMATGEIFSKEAYARGKLVESSGWSGKLPRGGTPSDIDLVFDNWGHILLVELNSRSALWSSCSIGQRRLYESLVLAGNGWTWAVCCHWKQPDDTKYISSYDDVLAFQLMTLKRRSIVYHDVIEGASEWQRFVPFWFERTSR
jgi:hypothetical protein